MREAEYDSATEVDEKTAGNHGDQQHAGAAARETFQSRLDEVPQVVLL
jgi:hypothetical protein